MVEGKGSFKLILVEPLFPGSLNNFRLLWIPLQYANEVSNTLQLADEEGSIWAIAQGMSMGSHVNCRSQ
jgi:hypothetical protein